MSKHSEAMTTWLRSMQEWEESHDRYKMAADLIDAYQARISELESALQEVVEFHSPYAWGSEDNKRDALNNAISVLESK